jgi:hypothetical protein
MAQFDFLGSWNDSWDIVAAILENKDLRLVPDLRYDKPEPLFATALDDSLKAMLLDRGNGFLWSTRFSRYPPVMGRIEGGEAAGKYTVSLTRGGPYLRLGLPFCYEEGGVINLAAGSLYYPSWFLNPEATVSEKASPELRAGFKDVKAVIRRHLVRLKSRPDIWSGREASRLVEGGRARVRGFERPG